VILEIKLAADFMNNPVKMDYSRAEVAAKARQWPPKL
jgi:hypothetical protein